MNRKVVMYTSLATAMVFLWAVPGLDDVESGRLLSGDIRVDLNPTGIAPLTAIVSFQTISACDVLMRIAGREEIVRYFDDDSLSHEIPILGLYPGRVNYVFFTLIDPHGTHETKMVTITTDPLPVFLPTIRIETCDPSRMEPGMTLCDLSISKNGGTYTYPIMFDRNGEIRWYLDLSGVPGFCVPFERLSDGNFVFAMGESIYEYDMFGRQTVRIEIKGYNFHHDIREIPGNRFLAAVDKPGTKIITDLGERPTIEDHVVAIDRGTGRIVNEWDLRRILDVRRNPRVNSSGDWFHLNSIWHCPSDNCLILSGRHQGVVKVTWDNRLVWILAPHLGWGPAGWDGSGPETRSYLLTALDAAGNRYPEEVQLGSEPADDFDWPWAQHDARLTPAGTICLFDNGDFRNWFRGVSYSRIAEYRIDEKAMTVTQVWDFGRSRGEDLYSQIISGVDVLPVTGNRSMSPGLIPSPSGTFAKFVELTYPGLEVVFEAKIKFTNLAIAGGEFSFDSVYRSRRVSLYPD